MSGEKNSCVCLESSVGMTRDEIEKYLLSILKNEVKLSGLESIISRNFVEAKNQQQQLAAKIQQLSADLERGKRLFSELKGRVDENARLLIDAENDRRERKD